MILNQKTYMKKHIIKQLISKQKAKKCALFIFPLIIVFSLLAYIARSESLQCVKIGFVYTIDVQEAAFAQIFYKVHKCLFNNMDVEVVIVDYDGKIDKLTYDDDEINLIKNKESKLKLRKARHNSCIEEVHFKAAKLADKDYHDYIILTWFVQEYSTNRAYEIDKQKMEYITSDNMLKLLYSLIDYDLNVEKMLENSQELTKDYWKVGNQYNFGRVSLSNQNNDVVPEVIVMDNKEQKQIMIFDEFFYGNALYVTFLLNTSIEESRKEWMNTNFEQNLAPIEKERGCLFDGYYFPKCHIRERTNYL